jgi:hypothetical protein
MAGCGYGADYSIMQHNAERLVDFPPVRAS